MAANRQWRLIAKPLLLKPWEPSSNNEAPPEDIVPPVEEKLRQKCIVMEYIEEHDAELEWGPGAKEWPDIHIQAIWDLSERWRELHAGETELHTRACKVCDTMHGKLSKAQPGAGERSPG